MATMRAAYHHYSMPPHEVRDGVAVMSTIVAHSIQEDGAPRLRQALARRSCCWLRRIVPPGDLDLVLERLRVIFFRTPTGLQLVRAWCNAWPMARRFGEGPSGYRCGCCAVRGDALRHYLSCPALLQAIETTLSLWPPVWGSTGDACVAFNALRPGARDVSVCVCVCAGAEWFYPNASVSDVARHSARGRTGSNTRLLRCVHAAVRSLVIQCLAARIFLQNGLGAHSSGWPGGRGGRGP